MKWVEAIPVPEKSCGTCSLCCKLFEIDWLDRPKPAGSWCHHCRPGKGCTIWQHVPTKCADYYCVWRVDPDLPAEWRPDTARFILTHAHSDAPLAVLVDPQFPVAYRREPYWSKLRETAQGILEGRGSTIVIFVGKKRFVLLPDGEVPIPDGVELHHVHLHRHEGVSGPHWTASFSNS